MSINCRMFVSTLKPKVMNVNSKLVEAANLALVSLGVFVAIKYHTPITIAIGALAFVLGITDVNLKKK